MDFKVEITHISNLPEDFCRNIYCEYEFYMDKTKYTTQVCTGKNQSPQMNYEKQHHIDCVTKFMIDYLLEDKMTIKIFGNQDLKKKRGGSKGGVKKPGQVSTSESMGTTMNSSNASSNMSQSQSA